MECFPTIEEQGMGRKSEIPLTPEWVYGKGRAITLKRWKGWAKAARQKLDDSLLQNAQLRQTA